MSESDLSEISSVASLLDMDETPFDAGRRASVAKLHTVQRIETFGKLSAPSANSSSKMKESFDSSSNTLNLLKKYKAKGKFREEEISVQDV